MIEFDPRPYQPPAHEFLCSHARGNLYMDPGLGKTVTALWAVQTLDLSDVLIVAPWLVVREVWAKEAQKWTQFADMQCVPIIGDEQARKVLALSIPRISVINYELLIWLFLHYGEDWPFRHVIYDESPRLAGYRVKESTRRALAIAQHAHGTIEGWWNLTGTPNANSYLQLWGPQWFIDGGSALGRSYGAYEDRWFYLQPSKKGYYRKKLLLPGAEQEITQRMRPTTFAVRARDYFDVADPIERTVWIDLPEAARTQYNSMRRKFYAQLEEGAITAANCGVKALKLRQLSSGAVYYNEEHDYSVVHTERLAALDSIVTELMGAPLLIVYTFRHELELILARLKHCTDIRLPGAIADWNAGRLPFLALHAGSAGHGLNLQDGGHHICYYSPYSDNELYSQVLQRIGPVRQLQSGYDRPVYIHHIEAHNTVDQVSRWTRENRATELEGFLNSMAEGEPA